MIAIMRSFRSYIVNRTSNANLLLSIVLLTAIFLSRPNVLGESYSFFATCIVSALAVVAVVRARGQARISEHALSILVLLALSSTWVIFRAPYSNPPTLELVRGEILNFITVVAWAVAVGTFRLQRQILRLVIAIVLIQSASQLVTNGFALIGFPGMVLGQFGTGEYVALVRFPISIDVGEIYVGGAHVPRLAGLGREPGWMSMYAAFAWFAWPLVGRPTLVGRLILIGGLLSPVSTAGFGVFVVVLGIEVLRRAAGSSRPLRAYFGVLGSLLIVTLCIYTALYAPVFGLNAKSTQSAASLSERDLSTSNGIEALKSFSLGERVDYPRSDINLIAAVASKGWIYGLLVLAILLVPVLLSGNRWRVLPCVLVLTLTILLAQPPGGSVFVIVLTMILASLPILPVSRGSSFSRPLDHYNHRPKWTSS